MPGSMSTCRVGRRFPARFPLSQRYAFLRLLVLGNFSFKVQPSRGSLLARQLQHNLLVRPARRDHCNSSFGGFVLDVLLAVLRENEANDIRPLEFQRFPASPFTLP